MGSEMCIRDRLRVLLVKFEVRMPAEETVRCVSFRSWGSSDCCRRKRPMIDVSDFELGVFPAAGLSNPEYCCTS